MAKLPINKCRVCGGPIDRNILVENVDWIKPKNNQYYHKKCYETWKNSNPEDDESWKDFIYDFISRDLKVPYDYFKCEAQRKKFLKQDMTNRGIFFALKYFYDVKHGDWNKGYNGIGIVPYVYKESTAYWANKERNNAGVLAQIEKQMEEKLNRKTKTVVKKKKKKTVDIDFSGIAEMEDDE